MGIRLRKSINLGGGFRINLSKSGIGYSWGFPGYRITKTANNRMRNTYSIPGTGISYVEESKVFDNNPNINWSETTKLITGETEYFENIDVKNMGKDDPILKEINKLRIINTIANISLISIYLCPVGILLKILIATKWKIDLKYEFDEFSLNRYNSLNAFLIEISRNKKVWQINSSTTVSNVKYNSGANASVTRSISSIKKSMPKYIKGNIEIYCLKLKKEKVYFTPDRILIFSGLKSVGVRSYRDLTAIFSYTNFVETEFVSKDATIIDYTWKFVNKNGGPDKRFSNNRKIPVCKYGNVKLETNDGINISLDCSNQSLMESVQNKFIDFMNYHNEKIEDEKVLVENSNYYGLEANEVNDPLYYEVMNYVIINQKASASFIQRKFKITYDRAVSIINLLEKNAVIGPQNGENPRIVLIKSN